MHIDVIQDEAALVELAEEWNALPLPSPTQSPAWLIPWWQSYSIESSSSPPLELSTLAFRDDHGRLCGLAPLYVERRRVLGNTLRLLGDGRACSDHATILSQPERQTEVVDALADWLIESSGTRWHSIRFESIECDEPSFARLLSRLSEVECWVTSTADQGTCAITLPESWEEFLSLRSKNHRKRCRRWDRSFFQSGRASTRRVHTLEELEIARRFLVSLHNERRSSVGEGGAFEDPEFAMFHELALPALLKSGQLWLQLLEIDGETRAIEYALCDHDTVYAYQSGLDDAGAELGAGNLSLMGLIQGAIAAGKTRLDLMRGQEAYKFHWGAEELESQTLLIYSRSLAGIGDMMLSRTRSQLRRVKQLYNSGKLSTRTGGSQLET